MNIVVSPAAAGDLDRLRAFLLDNNPQAAERAVQAILRAIQSLGLFPERGRKIGDSGMRELFVAFGRSSYVLRYARLPGRDTVLVIRVWHGREARM